MQARPIRHFPLTAFLGPFYLLQPGSVHLPHSVQWRSPRCSVQPCIDSSDPSPVPGHAADTVGSRRLQVPGARASGLAGACFRAPLGDAAGRGRLPASAKQPLALRAGGSRGKSFSGTGGQGRLGPGARCATARACAGPLRGALIMARGLDVNPCVSASSVRRPEGSAARCRASSSTGPWHVPYGPVAAQPIRPVERPDCPHIYLAEVVALAA